MTKPSVKEVELNSCRFSGQNCGIHSKDRTGEEDLGGGEEGEEKEEGEGGGERKKRREEEEEKTLVILKFPPLPLSFPPPLPPHFHSSTQHNMTNSTL